MSSAKALIHVNLNRTTNWQTHSAAQSIREISWNFTLAVACRFFIDLCRLVNSIDFKKGRNERNSELTVSMTNPSRTACVAITIFLWARRERGERKLPTHVILLLEEMIWIMEA